jgi:hypothetical protein
LRVNTTFASREAKIYGKPSIRQENIVGMIQNYGHANGYKVDLSAIVPARLDAKQTAGILGFQEHDIPVLVSHGQLEPLGKPPTPNCTKYFSRVQIFEVADDLSWLSKATKTIYQYRQGKNASRKSKGEEAESSRSE